MSNQSSQSAIFPKLKWLGKSNLILMLEDFCLNTDLKVKRSVKSDRIVVRINTPVFSYDS